MKRSIPRASSFQASALASATILTCLLRRLVNAGVLTNADVAAVLDDAAAELVSIGSNDSAERAIPFVGLLKGFFSE